MDQLPGHTVDHVLICPGMTLFAIEEGAIVQRIAKAVEGRWKVLYQDPPEEGYIGSRIDGVYAHYDSVLQAKKRDEDE